MWLRFKRHKVALVSAVFLTCLYISACCMEFFQTQHAQHYLAEFALAPPQQIHLIDRTPDGLRIRPFVYGYTWQIDPVSFNKTYRVNKKVKNYFRLFGQSDVPYHLMGIFKVQTRLITPSDYDIPFFLFGSDKQGRDLFSRLMAGTRISLSIGLIGVFISLILGILIGGISGYMGGAVDSFIQRLIELIQTLPTIPLWLAFSMTIPKHWNPLTVYFLISIILSLIGWTTMARVVRGRFMALKSQDFIAAAQLDGAGMLRIIWKHMTPLFISHIIATTTLAIPTIILSETALSFLGLGLQPPIVSWGVLLQQCRSIQVLSQAPWLLLPGLMVTLTVLAMNFFGDGLRDAADPYHTSLPARYSK